MKTVKNCCTWAENPACCFGLYIVALSEQGYATLVPPLKIAVIHPYITQILFVKGYTVIF
jgi:hypothetical protein